MSIYKAFAFREIKTKVYDIDLWVWVYAVEIAVVVDLIDGLLKTSDVTKEDIGVMAPYRRQVRITSSQLCLECAHMKLTCEHYGFRVLVVAHERQPYATCKC
jgi:hypothetical protein